MTDSGKRRCIDHMEGSKLEQEEGRRTALLMENEVYYGSRSAYSTSCSSSGCG